MSFLPTQVCEGRALQLITDLPVEFHCNKGSYSCWQDGEKPALAAAIALLRGVSKMKRLDFEARLLPQTPKLSTQSNAMQCNATTHPCFFITFSIHAIKCTLRVRDMDKSQSQYIKFEITGSKYVGYYKLSGLSLESFAKFCKVHSWPWKQQLTKFWSFVFTVKTPQLFDMTFSELCVQALFSSCLQS